VRQNDIISVTRLSQETASLAGSQGREVRTYYLNFLSAVDVAVVVQGLLSPVGKSFVIESSPLDKRRTREQLVVEDMPDYLLRVEQYLASADVPPRQVLIEAHVLQVELKDQFQHGVDINALLASVNGTDITLKTTGFTNPADSPAFFLGVDGAHLDLLVEAIQQTTDSKTLASPKVLVVNGQEARIQVGQQLGFRVTTTTQTSTLQQVQFLDVGVVLRVTPQITQDNQILMTVKPEVSKGRINPVTELPEEDTTEVETTIMLGDGRGMIIGGLIQEEDTENQSKIPLVGDLWAVGRLFQKRSVLRHRTEILIALTPRLVPYTPNFAQIQDRELVRATSPLVGPQLQHIDRRPYEPQLSDALWNPRTIALSRIPHFYHNLHDPYPLPLRYYLPAVEGDGVYNGYFPPDPTILGGNSNPLPRPPMMMFPPAPVCEPPPLPQ
jgi:type II secretory pathway component GspD/PulD (secretin)